MRKKRVVLVILSGMICCLFGIIIGKDAVKAAAVLSVNENGDKSEEVGQMDPRMLTTGGISEKDKYAAYFITFTEEEKNSIVVPMRVTKDGKIKGTLLSTRLYNGDLGNMTAAVYTDISCEHEILSLSVACGEKEQNIDTWEHYLEKGTYYFKVSLSKEAKSKYGFYGITLFLQGISGEDRTLKTGNWSIAAAKEEGKQVTFFKIKASSTGYFVVNKKDGGKNIKVALCNSSKKEILSDCKKDKEVFAVKKGIYYLKVSGAIEDYRICYQFKKVTDSSGSSKKNAKQIILGGSSVQGVILMSDQKTKEDWYKFVLEKDQYVELILSGSVSEGTTMKIQVIPPEYVTMKGDTYLNFRGVDLKGNIHPGKNNNGGKWCGGTWYIKVTKTKQKGSAKYSMRIK